MEDFKKLPKMQHFKTGGSVKAYTKRDRKETDAADIKQDKAIVKKAFKMHDTQEHKGEKTDLSKLKKGGRTKKEVGTVKKYKCGGGVKKMADGSSVEKAALLNALPGKVNEIERAQMAARAKNALKYLGPAQQSEFVKQGGMNPAGARLTNADLTYAQQAKGMSTGSPAGSTVPAGQKKGGKVKKYAGGSSVYSEDVGATSPKQLAEIVKNAKRSADMDPGIMPKGPMKPRTINIDGREVEMKSIPMPPTGNPDRTIKIPGVGEYKPGTQQIGRAHV